ncbi:MAG: Uma2 family endonuclease [Gammaproteobacteria bacterium]|nr:Uma2 family endonuclease [Gammaproteobacteria bacterium]MYF28412.1 Uma2 family endonuclease [Gammaproteobacteria bacterium]MYK45032.1 Uma2 family endonuclease [Gammaproteobacteria bacterium]
MSVTLGAHAGTCLQSDHRARNHLWYFRTMVTEPPPSLLRAGAGTTAPHAPIAPQPSLAARHARALYRPVPPVGYDDEGHPESDSATVESDTHEDVRAYAVRALRIRYAARPAFYAAADMGLLFERGNPAAVMAPDLLVALGAGRRARTSYKLWQEPVPDLVMELLSPKTWRRDVETKPGLYEALGVREFWLFDPVGKLPCPINGWHLDVGGAYVPVPALPDGGCRSAVLGLDLLARGDGFRFRDPATGEFLPDHAETAAELRTAQARVAELEAHVAELQLRGES